MLWGEMSRMGVKYAILYILGVDIWVMFGVKMMYGGNFIQKTKADS